MMETLSGCECDGEVGCAHRDCTAKHFEPFEQDGAEYSGADMRGDVFVQRRPAGISPAEWRARQAAELRAIVRRTLTAGAPDPFA